MAKWWTCSKGKYYNEHIALLKAQINGGAVSTGNSTNYSDIIRLSLVIGNARLRWVGHVARMDESVCLGD
jgi:hypothetical protein